MDHVLEALRGRMAKVLSTAILRLAVAAILGGISVRRVGAIESE